MNFIIRGILTLKEKKGRTVILLGIMFTVCVVILASFGIQSGAQAAAVLAREKLGAVVTVSQNMEKMMQKQRDSNEQGSSTAGERKRLTMEKKDVPLEYVDLLKENDHVTGYYLSKSAGANLTELLPVGKEKEAETTTTENKIAGFGKENGGNSFINNIPKGMHMSGDITISGVNNFSMSDEYVNGESVLSEGESITESNIDTNVVMVEKTFADENSLAVGSTFSIEDTDGNNVIQVEVIGIYTSSKEVSDNGFINTSQLPYNTIIAPYTLVSSINSEEATTGVNTIKFYLDDPLNVDSFVEFAKSTTIDFDTYSVDGGTKEYEDMMKPIENVASFSKTTIIIVSVFGGVILALIIILSIKDRTSEIGMLMALGERRVKVIGQFLVEALIVLVVAFSLSIIAGNAISSKIGDVLLEKELTTTESIATNTQGGGMPNRPGGMNFGNNKGGLITTTEKIEELDIDISTDEVGKMAELAFIIVILGTIVPSVMIMRYNPKTILSKHS
ncbi:ABC transporter permease [Clostridium sp. LP20]|uniref:ABC transporter permease n=1 Tax=Clostridium sp. LP20 TaxID=3418665 RepID=UPI003EE5F32A